MQPPIDLTHTIRMEQQLKATKAAKKLLIEMAQNAFKACIISAIVTAIILLFFFCVGIVAHALWSCALAGWLFLNRF